MRYEPGAYPRPFLLSRVSTPTNSPTGELGEASGLAAAGYGMEHCHGSGTRHDAVCYRRREMQNTEDAGYGIEHCRSSGIRHDAVCYRRREMQNAEDGSNSGDRHAFLCTMPFGILGRD